MEVAERKPLDATAYGVTLTLCAVWGVQQVVIKLTAPEVSLLMQGAIRSIIATVLVLVWARLRGIPLLERDGTARTGLLAGSLFAVEFVFIYYGLGHTTASRMSVFVYLAPIFAALFLHATVPGERLAPAQWLGVLLAFAGVAVAFSEGFTAARGSTLLGDACGVVAALLWAATTTVIRATNLARVAATKTFLYQIGCAAIVLPLASLALGEPGVVSLSGFAVASLAYQGILAGFATLLAWFWLLRHYLAARLGVLSFVTPLLGVLSGVVFLGDPLTGHFLLAALAVGAGIVLVNFRR
ncbi:MAG TPA: DMT family transporter [Burkholderiales bacterium]|nr:DMT family transporter [Burkholderiales bacterium]